MGMEGTSPFIVLRDMCEKMDIKPMPSVEFAVLKEIGRLTEMAAESMEKPTPEIVEAYTYLADEYFRLGHRLLSDAYCKKAGIKPYRSTLKADPLIYTAEYAAILPELEDKIYMEFKARSGTARCFAYWKAKKEILKKDYGMDWKTPRELNPDVRFD